MDIWRLVIGIGCLIAGWVGAYLTYLLVQRQRRRRSEDLTRDVVYGELPVSICICGTDRQVIVCNTRFAGYFQEDRLRIRGKLVSELFDMAGKLLVNAGALVDAKKSWNSAFEGCLRNPDRTYDCPPFEFRIDADSRRYVSFTFRRRSLEDGRSEVFFGLNDIRVSFEMPSVVPTEEEKRSMEVRIEYKVDGKPYTFEPHSGIFNKVFSALERSGPYACVGSSAIKIHSNNFGISSIDVIVPYDKSEAEEMATKLERELGEDWTRFGKPEDGKPDTHEMNGTVAEYYAKASDTSVSLKLVRKIGSWRLDKKAATRTRSIERANVRTRFLSPEDAILLYVFFNDKLEMISIHREALKEIVRALVCENVELQRREFNSSVKRMGFSDKQKVLAESLFEKVVSARDTFKRHYPISPEGDFEHFNRSWEALLERGEVEGLFLTDSGGTKGEPTN
jgi:hypothetical protein